MLSLVKFNHIRDRDRGERNEKEKRGEEERKKEGGEERRRGEEEKRRGLIHVVASRGLLFSFFTWLCM